MFKELPVDGKVERQNSQNLKKQSEELIKQSKELRETSKSLIRHSQKKIDLFLSHLPLGGRI